MKSFLFCLLIVPSSLWADAPKADKSEDLPRPNILFILCDDLGYGDLGIFFQNEHAKSGKPAHATPRLDQLAEEGLQLQHHYVPAPVCAPSRATLFLGQHQGNSPIRDNQFDKALPEQPTLASVLQSAGYATTLVGKYGLQGKNGQSPQTWPAYPTKRGFDDFLGYVRHVDGHEHYPFDRVHHKKHKTEVWWNDEEISSKLKGCYTADLWTAYAKKWIIDHQQKAKDKPFFMMLSYDTPHAATQLAAAPYPKGTGQKGGLQWLGKSGEMINTAGGKPDSYLFPDYADKDWPMIYKRYASSVRRIDQGVGDILDLLKELNLEDNTLVIFTSDNGPSQESYLKAPFSPSFFESFGEMDGIKRDCWEGGIRVGALVKWPKHIPAGSESTEPSQFQDWMPTLAQLAKAPCPALSDGISLVNHLARPGTPTESTVYVEYSVGGKTPNYETFAPAHRKRARNQMQVLRRGALKAVRYSTKNAETPFEIYDVVKDPQETENLAGKAGIPSQAEWEGWTRQAHANEDSAKRPYDGAIIPPTSDKIQTAPGLLFAHSPEEAGYAYSLSRAKFSPVPALEIPAGKGNVEFSTYLKVDQAGKYEFQAAQGAHLVVRVHDITVLDSDSAQGRSKRLNLAAGLHPVTISVRLNGSGIKDPLKFKRPGEDEFTVIPSSAWLRVN